MDDEDTLDEPEESLEQARNAAAKNHVSDAAGVDDETIPAGGGASSLGVGDEDETIPAGKSASSVAGLDDETIDVDPELIRRLREQRAQQQPTDQPTDPDQAVVRESHDPQQDYTAAKRKRRWAIGTAAVAVVAAGAVALALLIATENNEPTADVLVNLVSTTTPEEVGDSGDGLDDMVDVSALDELNVAFFLAWPTANQVAQAEDTYGAELGLKVNWIPFASGSDMAQAMETGEIDIAYSQGLTPFVNAVTAGSEFELVAIAVSYADHGDCVAHPDAAITAENAREALVGATIMSPLGNVTEFSNVTEFKLTRMLEYFGLDISDVNVVGAKDGFSVLAAFKRGDIEVGCAFGEPMFSMLETGNTLWTGADQLAEGIRVFDVVSIPARFGAEHGDVVTQFLQVTEDANAAYAADPDSKIATIAQTADLDVDGTVQNLSVFRFPTKAEQLGADWFGGDGVNEAMLAQAESNPDALNDYSDFINTSYLEAVTVPIVESSGPCPSGGAENYSDVVAGSTHADDIACLRELGIPADGDTYRPREDITRSEMARFIAGAYEAVTGSAADVAEHPFTDVAGDPNQDDIARISGLNITNGVNLEGTLYAPDALVIRGHMALFLTRLYTVVAGSDAPADDTEFTDIGEISDEQQAAIGQIKALGVTTGTSATTYSPSDNLTREQMASFVTRLYRALLEGTEL